MADKELEPVKFGHEEQDVNSVAITKFGIGLTLTILVTLFLLWGLFHYFVSSDERAYGGAAPLAGVGDSAAKAPPQPRLQASPPIDLRDMRAAEDQLLQHYSWVDRDKGVVRIPIERAMDILAERGLPSRPAAGRPQGTTNERGMPARPTAGPPQGAANERGLPSQSHRRPTARSRE